MRRTLGAILAAALSVSACAGPGGAGRPAPVTSQQDAALLVLAGDYAPADGLGVLTRDQWDALLPVYGAAEQTGLPCLDMARTLQRTGDYRADMGACLGDEDSPAVDVLLTLVGK
jgi:hypothetical protein